MQRIAGPGAIGGLFVEEDTGTGQPPTQITAAWMNAVQEELANVIEGAEITLNPASNSQLLAAINALITLGVRPVPIGGIIAWSGSIATIPLHWALCDGTGGTHDLRDHFIMGAGGSYTVGSTGGSADAIVVAHGHAISETPHTHLVPQAAITVAAGALPAYSADLDPVVNSGPATTGITIEETGTSGVGANLPPFYVLAWIQLMS